MNDILLKPAKKPDIQAMLGKWLKKTGAAEPPHVSAGASAGTSAGAETIPSEFAIPVEEADIVPVTKTRAEILGLGDEGGTRNPVPARGREREGVIFSSAEVLEAFLGNEEMVFSLLGHFLERTQGQIEGFPALAAAGDWETARREAHTIKGAALTLSGGELGKAAARLEGASKNKHRPETEAAYQEVKEAFARFKDEAGKFLKRRRQKPPDPSKGLSQ
jgi:HPt (histidine-containing phosphotransfer) domain-containing protein